jgi:hypothetical protein
VLHGTHEVLSVPITVVEGKQEARKAFFELNNPNVPCCRQLSFVAVDERERRGFRGISHLITGHAEPRKDIKPRERRLKSSEIHARWLSSASELRVNKCG